MTNDQDFGQFAYGLMYHGGRIDIDDEDSTALRTTLVRIEARVPDSDHLIVRRVLPDGRPRVKRAHTIGRVDLIWSWPWLPRACA